MTRIWTQGMQFSHNNGGTTSSRCEFVIALAGSKPIHDRTCGACRQHVNPHDAHSFARLGTCTECALER